MVGTGYMETGSLLRINQKSKHSKALLMLSATLCDVLSFSLWKRGKELWVDTWLAWGIVPRSSGSRWTSSSLPPLHPFASWPSSPPNDLPHQASKVTFTPLMNHVPSCFSRVCLFVTLWTVGRQALLSMRFSRQEYWSGLPYPPPGDLPYPGIKSVSLISPALAGGFFFLPLAPPGEPSEPQFLEHFCTPSYPIQACRHLNWFPLFATISPQVL